MANNCEYQMMAASKDRASLERLFKVMRYEDGEFYMYRVFDVLKQGRPRKRNGLWTLELYGDVAWAAGNWLIPPKGDERKCEAGGSYASLPTVCKALGVGVETWSKEPGMEFEEHIAVSSDGSVLFNQTAEWGYDVDDESCEITGEHGGFDDFGGFDNPRNLVAA